MGLVRGVQRGYNICNDTTQNQESLCQTSYYNNATGQPIISRYAYLSLTNIVSLDFCLWAPPDVGKEVGEIEGEMIAWCTKKHGTRLIPNGAITGLQHLRTPDYIQVVGFIDQTKINMKAGDFGGEMDPHGADLRGNPMGGILYSNIWTGDYVQAVEWTKYVSMAFVYPLLTMPLASWAAMLSA